MKDKPKPSNPFFPDDSGLNYMPDLGDINQQLVDDAVREEIDAGQLSGLLLTRDANERILGSR